MTAFNYSRTRARAESLIARFGQAATIRRGSRSGPSYDPYIITADHACRAVVLAYSDKQIDGSRIKAGDKLVYVSTAGLTIEPTEQDQIIIGGVAHEIVNLKPLAPAGIVVFYECGARR